MLGEEVAVTRARVLVGMAGKALQWGSGDHLSIHQAAVSTKHWCLRQAPGLTGAFSPSGKPYSGEWTAKWSYLYSLATNIPNSGFFSFIPKPAAQNYQRWQVGALRIMDSKHYAGQKYGRAEGGRRAGCLLPTVPDREGRGRGREGGP